MFGITQGVIPNHAEKKVRDRLTRNGGSADVTIRAIPAIRLLFDDGDELDVDARGIEVPARELRGGSFKQLDGFDRMRFEMIRSEVGPFTADRALADQGRGGAELRLHLPRQHVRRPAGRPSRWGRYRRVSVRWSRPSAAGPPRPRSRSAWTPS